MSSIAAPTTAAQAAADTFGERAAQMLAFLVERHGTAGTPRRREQELTEWIARWRKAQRDGFLAAQHFTAHELGFILRALNGPPVAPSRLPERQNEQLCWLIAQCMNHPHLEARQ